MHSRINACLELSHRSQISFRWKYQNDYHCHCFDDIICGYSHVVFLCVQNQFKFIFLEDTKSEESTVKTVLNVSITTSSEEYVFTNMCIYDSLPRIKIPIFYRPMDEKECERERGWECCPWFVDYRRNNKWGDCGGVFSLSIQGILLVHTVSYISEFLNFWKIMSKDHSCGILMTCFLLALMDVIED